MANRSKALSLYKSILRAHERYLPNAMRSLGDSYVKNEFRLHKSAQPEQAVQFFDEWENYLRHIEQTGREKQSIDVGLVDQPGQGTTISMGAPNNRGSFGKDVANDVELSEEQQSQLEKLREEAAKAGLGNN